MSTMTTPAEAPVADAPAFPASEPGVQTFRGRTLEELLPQIRGALGPDAIVLRQRDGLMGGIGGFFQQRFVEVDATSGRAHSLPSRPRIDVYDEEPEASPESFSQLLADAEVAADPVVTAAAIVAPALTDPDDRAGGSEDARATAGRRSCAPGWAGPGPTGPTRHGAGPATVEALTDELTRAGMSHAFAERLVLEAEAHELPFTHGDLRAAVRRALARRLPTSLPHRAGGLAVAFAGPGSTGCADALVTAYKRAGRDARAVASLDKARVLLERGDADAVVAVDLPPVAAARAEVDALAARVATLQLDELVAVVPAELELPSARALVDRLRPLSPTALALDACDARLGAAIELACTTRLPILYVQDDTGIASANPAMLAERLLT
jgi:hypothetical protein